MKRIEIVIEKASDGNYWCRTIEKIGRTSLVATGDTVEEAKEDLLECYREAKEDAEECGEEFYDVTFEYKYDIQSFFNYFSFFNLNEIARRAGINPSLLRQYNGGFKNAGEKTYKRLSTCIEEIRKELQVASF